MKNIIKFLTFMIVVLSYFNCSASIFDLDLNPGPVENPELSEEFGEEENQQDGQEEQEGSYNQDLLQRI